MDPAQIQHFVRSQQLNKQSGVSYSAFAEGLSNRSCGINYFCRQFDYQVCSPPHCHILFENGGLHHNCLDICSLFHSVHLRVVKQCKLWLSIINAHSMRRIEYPIVYAEFINTMNDLCGCKGLGRKKILSNFAEVGNKQVKCCGTENSISSSFGNHSFCVSEGISYHLVTAGSNACCLCLRSPLMALYAICCNCRGEGGALRIFSPFTFQIVFRSAKSSLAL